MLLMVLLSAGLSNNKILVWQDRWQQQQRQRKQQQTTAAPAAVAAAGYHWGSFNICNASNSSNERQDNSTDCQWQLPKGGSSVQKVFKTLQGCP